MFVELTKSLNCVDCHFNIYGKGRQYDDYCGINYILRLTNINKFTYIRR